MPRGDHWPHWRVRLAANVVISPHGCHEWQASRNSRGYGVIWFEGKLHLAHRAAWFERHGSWPSADRVLDHICENKGCVNADHLREMTSAANIRRAVPAYGTKGGRRAVV